MTATQAKPIEIARPVRIALTRGQVALIDAEDIETVGQYSWTASWAESTNSFYAVTTLYAPKRTLSMHRLIIGASGEHIDHVNHDTLDNRRSNLRPATRSENMRNRRSWGASGYLGVYARGAGKWAAKLRINGVQIYLGQFDTATEAAIARDEYVRASHPSEFWTFNFPRPGERGIHRDHCPANTHRHA